MAKIIQLEDLNRREVAIYKERSEVQLARIYEPNPGLFIAESAKVIERALEAGYEPESFLVETKELEDFLLRTKELENFLLKTKELENFPSENKASGNSLSKTKELEGIPVESKGLKTFLSENRTLQNQENSYWERLRETPVYTADISVLKEITGYELTRGILCAMKRKRLPSLEEVCKGKRRIAVLENVQNPTNVGAILRSAAAMGVEAVLLTYDCSDPLYRRAIRVSMGNVFLLPWTVLPKDYPWIESLHKMGFATAALALNEDSVSIDDEKLMKEPRLAMVLGNEGEGLLQDTIAECDYTVKIPMASGVDSLNVAAASAVAFWQLCRPN